MKRQSDTSGGANEPREPVFFTDRDLGKRFPEILRAANLRVESYRDHFGEDPVDDPTWLTVVGANGWVVVSHDRAQIGNRDERDAAMRAQVRAFYVVGDAPFPKLAEAFVEAIDEVREILSRRHEPFLAKVYRPAPGQPHRVRIVLTLSKWLKKLK